MPASIELHIFGQVLRLNCSEGQHAGLKAAAKDLESRVELMKDRTNILQLERILAIVALNLSYELNLEKDKNLQQQQIYSRIQEFDASLSHALENVKQIPSFIDP